MILAVVENGAWWVTLVAGAAGMLIVLIGLGVRRPRAAVQPPEELHQAVAELGDLTRRLEELIVAADQRIEELRGLTEGGKDAKRQADTDPLARKIYKLADAGRDPAQIAQELDEHIGKVELVLALRTQTTEM